MIYKTVNYQYYVRIRPNNIYNKSFNWQEITLKNLR